MAETITPTLTTLTFLFTDIEGSTKLAQHYPEAMPTLLARHHRILRDAIMANGGHVFRTVGDAFCAAFNTAADALYAALMAQRALQLDAGKWKMEVRDVSLITQPSNFQSPTSNIQIRVRMGIHTGVTQAALTSAREDDYAGYLTLARVQRVMSTAYGGQILVSSATADLLQRQLPDGVSLRDLGEHRLKGLLNLERLWQVSAPDLRADFPPLETLNAVPNNLPAQLSTFVGREQEIAELKQHLGSTRLLTLTGPGGVGKTRLSLQIATDLIEDFPDGVWFIEFAPVSDPTLAPQAMAAPIGVREAGGRPLSDTLADYLRDKRVLVILDNCEHLIGACAQLADGLLRTAPPLKLLASSREALGIAGELAWSVPSLPSPDPARLPSLEMLMQFDAVRLFVERAQLVLSSFSLSNANAHAIAHICRRLDGIPLAIELAAARVKALSVEQIAARLDDRFRLLTTGSRTALQRQQTLRALIDWSYELLSEPERTLLRRLSVFAGGWTLEAAEAVSSEQSTVNSGASSLSTVSPSRSNGRGHRSLFTDDILDLLAQLVNKSLVIVEERDGETRYQMLETIREYAREKLAAAGEAEQTRTQHSTYFVQLATAAEPKLRGADQLGAIHQLETEYDNLREALRWSLDHAPDDALSIGGSIGFFWWMMGYTREGREWLETALTRGTPSASSARVQALRWASILHVEGGDMAGAFARLNEGVTQARELGDRRLYAQVLPFMTLAGMFEGPARGFAAAEESIALCRELGETWGLGMATSMLGEVKRHMGDLDGARTAYETGLAAARQAGDQFVVAGDSHNLAQVLLLQNQPERARAGFRECLGLSMRFRSLLPYCLAGLGSVAAATNQPTRAARLYGAADSAFASMGAAMQEVDRVVRDRFLEMARQQLDENMFNAARQEGAALSVEQAADYALQAGDAITA